MARSGGAEKVKKFPWG